jgi:small subunit ribosomal protein S6
MRIYETTFVVNPQTDDATINNRVQSVSGLITKNGGKIVLEDHMGTRRLAYPIKGLTQGYYGSFIFEGPAMVLPLLDRLYKQEESYIRYMTIQYEADPQELLNQRAAMGSAEDLVADRPETGPELPRPVAQRRPEPGDFKPRRSPMKSRK